MAYTVQVVGDISEQDKRFPTINLLLKKDSLTFKLDTHSQTDKVLMTLENVEMTDQMLVLFSRIATMKNPDTFVLNLSELNVMTIAREVMNSMTQIYVDCLYQGIRMPPFQSQEPNEEVIPQIPTRTTE